MCFIIKSRINKQIIHNFHWHLNENTYFLREGQFQKRYLTHQSLKSLMKISFESPRDQLFSKYM